MEPSLPTTSYKIATHCPYCAFQCGMLLSDGNGRINVDGDSRFPVNNGALCIKGWTSAETLNDSERLRYPLIRSSDGRLRTASWDAAMDRIVEAITDLQAKYGAGSIGMFGGGL